MEESLYFDWKKLNLSLNLPSNELIFETISFLDECDIETIKSNPRKFFGLSFWGIIPTKEIINDLMGLKNLLELSITYTFELEKISDSIGNLESLRSFNLKGTGIKVLPPSFTQLKNLVSISIDNTPLEILPENLDEFQNLVYLEVLLGGKLRSLSPKINKMKKLKYLHINNNQLVDMPDSIFLLPAIEEISLNNNMIKKIPRCYVNCKSLRSLGLHGNQIEDIDWSDLDFKNLEGLEFLDLEENPLSQTAKLFLKKENKSIKTKIFY